MPKMRYCGAEAALGRPQKLTTRAFEDSCCWLVLLVSKLACQKLLRILWRWVGAICSRVLARLEQAQPPRTAGLRRIGVDETSYKKGHSLHDGHGRKVFDAFFEHIGVKGREPIDLVSADGVRWVDDAMKEWVAHALRCTDTFHIVQWATELLDELRKQSWRKAAPKGRRARLRKGEKASPRKEGRCIREGPKLSPPSRTQRA